MNSWMTSPIFVVLGAFGVLLNLVFSGGTLLKLIDFAKEWGILKEKVHSHDTEILRLRDAHHDLRNIVSVNSSKGPRP